LAAISLAFASCAFLLASLPRQTTLLFLSWTLTGVLIYALYGYHKSPLRGQGSRMDPLPAIERSR
jgi:hypothetical protein